MPRNNQFWEGIGWGALVGVAFWFGVWMGVTHRPEPVMFDRDLPMKALPLLIDGRWNPACPSFSLPGADGNGKAVCFFQGSDAITSVTTYDIWVSDDALIAHSTPGWSHPSIEFLRSQGARRR